MSAHNEPVYTYRKGVGWQVARPRYYVKYAARYELIDRKPLEGEQYVYINAADKWIFLNGDGTANLDKIIDNNSMPVKTKGHYHQYNLEGYYITAVRVP